MAAEVLMGEGCRAPQALQGSECLFKGQHLESPCHVGPYGKAATASRPKGKEALISDSSSS